MIQERLIEIYEILLNRFGRQDWWPGDSRFEIAVGAILTQNTNWNNVEKAINNIKAENMLAPESLYSCPDDKLTELIRPAGYFNVKAKRLKAFLKWLIEDHGADIDSLENIYAGDLREELLSIKGIGRETADSIILYCLDKPCFVVDAYTARIFIRHQFIDETADYEQIKELFESALPEESKLYNEYHALIVQLGKDYCKKRRPLCDKCPLGHLPRSLEEEY
ncbi:endonuclease III domain-containing protein [Sedimentisphaera salicampi]|uniref:UV-endonuclease n=1 Tax=Sedimentisphaera salicampi TaxID=1941349 RepID=A0A1W6LLC4_9BACT|nr:endonuclease III domain-containing protein [Sedimentisphaera salicampi]ARN56571.1 UV-endonuclease [Sedimentisphaera salicampi]